MQRRAMLGLLGGAWVVDSVLPARRPPSGRIVGASHAAGHRLRAPLDPAPAAEADRADVVIVGGGIAGLSAAWRLAPAGLSVLVLELEPFTGGTSAWSDDGAVPYPWGAHYVAAPNPEARAALRLLSEMGVVTGWDAAGRAVFDPRRLCHAPQERIFYGGAWHQGLVPHDALDATDRDEMARFSAVEQELTRRTGSDGLAAFQIPVELSSRDPELLELDRISMAEWLARERFEAPFVRWYVRYAMLDDFGAEPDQVSAWAGLHYFASRKVHTQELEGSHFLVWPEGNGRLVEALRTSSRARVRTGALVTAVTTDARGVDVHWMDRDGTTPGRVRARAAILAVPGFVAGRLLAPAAARVVRRVSSPWVVANLHVTRPPDADMPWDSVLHEGRGLGYVDASHQLTEPVERTVLTYYRAWGGADVAAARAELLGASWESLAGDVLRDLHPAHPDLLEEADRIDVMVWGHAMPRPVPGFLGDPPLSAPVLLDERVAWAHVDQSGMALFEEAQARGVRAAEALAREGSIGVSLGDTWL